jgi:hypothetical protein
LCIGRRFGGCWVVGQSHTGCGYKQQHKQWFEKKKKIFHEDQ